MIVALVNERLDHLTGHLNRHYEAALLAAGAVAALAARGGCGSGVILVIGPGQMAGAHQPSGVPLSAGDLQRSVQDAAKSARCGHG